MSFSRSVVASLMAASSLIAMGGCALVVPAIGPGAIKVAAALPVASPKPVSTPMAPPAWLQGNWRSDDGQTSVSVSGASISYALNNAWSELMTPALSGALKEVENGDTAYRVEIDASNPGVTFPEEMSWVRQSDGTVRFTYKLASGQSAVTVTLKKK